MELESHRAPLYEALLAYRNSGQRSFHVPGHKNGQVYRAVLQKEEHAHSDDQAAKYNESHLGREPLEQSQVDIVEGEHVVAAYKRQKSPQDTTLWEEKHQERQSQSNVVPTRAFLEMMRMDVTEISGTDDLHHPEGVILEAQQLAADCYGAEESFFLVGGSTAGNLSLLLTVCDEPGSIVLVQRNVHKSVIHGLMLAGAKAVFMEPWVDPTSGLAVMPSVKTVQAAVQAYPDAKGLFVTLPNYYGMGADLSPIARICHEAGMPLLVDEAHGAHYGQHPELPASALSCGADGVVQSTHKMLSAFTMGAMLHVQGTRINRSLLRQRLAMVQSSSPSYPVMASLDLARRLLHVQGAQTFTAGLAAVHTFKRGLAELPRFQLLQPAALQQQGLSAEVEPADQTAHASAAQPEQMHGQAAAAELGHAAAGYTAQDPFKAVIYDGLGILSGYGLQQQLEARGCIPEMSDERYVVLLFSLGSTEEDAHHVLQALQDISLASAAENGSLSSEGSEEHMREEKHYISTWNNFQEKVSHSEPIPFSLQPIREEHTIEVTINECAGCRSAEMVIPYPPGIPLVYPGERISPTILARIQLLRDEGAKFHGVADASLQTMKVMKDKQK
ncbi:aminotransferase class I/II-fold pyridoxal phosphate-dependent enzyme [Paenibacillus sp. MER 99-2]|uniref:aminotransferase class I/II-fold pyridoxal phosphate-dependent enzyme n=1 Tax=Paenibacillus sp. MER 99-2 TaxID=2939572 RepID=UPI00203BA5A8|nr:aminotransferase class I/II-fold pyridoxal phosphate-dependent enzyme [Paenibacillus sp. MER 99-2]MCM3176012.1 aminotransferase class I/II-fold pyridoxal phosphate-dependent enzyme [Paenibacillus sp. MER 99-2]